MAQTKEQRRANTREWYANNREYHKKWRELNPERVKAAAAKHARGNRTAIKNRRLKRRYGITLAEREGMLLVQGGCAICGSAHTGSKNDWHVDHCHITKEVRGILCRHCNILLGAAKDNQKTLAAAIAYLKEHQK